MNLVYLFLSTGSFLRSHFVWLSMTSLSHYFIVNYLWNIYITCVVQSGLTVRLVQSPLQLYCLMNVIIAIVKKVFTLIKCLQFRLRVLFYIVFRKLSVARFAKFIFLYLTRARAHALS